MNYGIAQFLAKKFETELTYSVISINNTLVDRGKIIVE